MIDKLVDSIDAALSGIEDGATILVSGFGNAGSPIRLLEALIDQGANNLTIVSNNAGEGEFGLAALMKAGRVKKVICSYPRSAGSIIFEELGLTANLKCDSEDFSEAVAQMFRLIVSSREYQFC